MYKTSKSQKVATILKSIGHPIRVRILLILSDNKSITVSQLSKDLLIDQPVMSLHLAILRKLNIISVQKQGKESFYTIIDNSVKQVVSIIFHTRN